MKKITLFIFTISICLFDTKGQTKKLDCYSGYYSTSRNASKVIYDLEQNKAKDIIQYISSTASIDSLKLKSIQENFSIKYNKLSTPSPTVKVQLLTRSDSLGKYHYERTYYTIKEDSITYYFQIRLLLNLNDLIEDIVIVENSQLVRRDLIIRTREKDKNHPIPPEPPNGK